MTSDIRDVNNIRPTPNVILDGYNHDIQFYGAEIPGNINIEDLKKLGAVRLLILRIVREIDNEYKKGTHKKCLKDLILSLRQEGLNSFANLFSGNGCDIHDRERLYARWRDHVSHNAARLAISHKSVCRLWLQKAEDRLFEWRLTALNRNGITAFMRIHNIRYPMVDHDERKKLKNQLIISINKRKKFKRTKFYKVPYVEALDALRNCRVYIASGLAYITIFMMRSVILYHLRSHLKMQIIKSWNAIHRQRDDPRIWDLMHHVQKFYKPFKLKSLESETRMQDLDKLAVVSYPPCMRKLHEALRENHHLRNQGRVQFTLFLKDIGVPIEETIEFYKNEFTQKMDEKAFEKEYIYCIRHLYGLEGAKRHYSTPNCVTISEFNVDPDEYHGCPFMQDDIEDLGKMLTRWEIPSRRKLKILKLAGDNKCSEACSAYFEHTHGCCAADPIVHPIDFWAQSRRIH